MVIRLEDISAVLARCFGPDIDPDRQTAAAAAQVLRGWIPRQHPLEELSSRLQDALYGGLRARLGESMLICEGRNWRRIRTRDLEAAADALTGLLFDALSDTESNYELVRGWAFSAGSLAALDCLTRRFAAWQGPGDQALYRQFLDNRRREENLR